jgi:pimeloyl-ACP methyl ester carboxylesterase
MVAPFLPYPLRTADNPDGVADLAALQAMRRQWAAGFAGWLAQAAPPAFSPVAPPELVSQTVRAMLQCSLQAVIACNVTGAETDMRAELAVLPTPTLVLHGDADGSCPLELTGRKVAQLAPSCRLKVYPDATHTLVVEQAREMMADIVGFIGETADAPALEPA